LPAPAAPLAPAGASVKKAANTPHSLRERQGEGERECGGEAESSHPLDKDTRATHWRGLWSSSSTSSASALRVGQALPHGIPAGLCERS
jgi:hypothetical protein